MVEQSNNEVKACCPFKFSAFLVPQAPQSAITKPGAQEIAFQVQLINGECPKNYSCTFWGADNICMFWALGMNTARMVELLSRGNPRQGEN